MKTMLAVAVALLAGCAQFQPAVQTAVSQASGAADEVLATAEFTLCRAITVGAWSRAYGNDKAKADAWRTLCSQPVSEVPAKP